MSTFEIGDEVVLSEDGLSMYYHCEYNPHDQVGVVTDCSYEGLSGSYSLYVEWEDEGNCYSEEDLLLARRLKAKVTEVPALKGYALWISKQEVTQ